MKPLRPTVAWLRAVRRVGSSALGSIVGLLIGAAGPAYAAGHAYHSERTALFPVPLADETATMDHRIGGVSIGVAAPTVAWMKHAPAGAGVLVPRGQASLAVSRPFPERAFWRLSIEAGAPTEALPVSRSAAARPTRPVLSAGPGAGVFGETSAAWVVLSTDAFLSAVPSRLRLTCLDCYVPAEGANPTNEGTKLTLIPGARVQLGAGWRFGDHRAGLVWAVRTQPVLEVTRPFDASYETETRSRITNRLAWLPGVAASVRRPGAVWSFCFFVPIPHDRGTRFGPVLRVSLTPTSSANSRGAR